MLSGKGAFKRDTAPETLTAILREEPEDLSGPNRVVDPALERLVRHCLEKSPEERFQSARDLAYALSTLSSASGALSGATGRVNEGPGVRRRLRLAVPAGVAAGALLGALGTRALFWPKATTPPEFEVLTYSGSDGQPCVSPDGKTIAFVSSRDGKSRIWIKQVAGGTEAVLTDGPDVFPRFAPDGSAVLFVRTTQEESVVYRVPLVGGEPRRIVANAIEADWSPDGKEIAFVRSEVQGSRIGSSVHLVALDGTNERTVASVAEHLLARPRFSPDGRTLAALEGQGTGTNARRSSSSPSTGRL